MSLWDLLLEALQWSADVWFLTFGTLLSLCHGWLAVLYILSPSRDGFLLSTNMRVLHHLAMYSCSCINSLLGAAQYPHSSLLWVTAEIATGEVWSKKESCCWQTPRCVLLEAGKPKLYRFPTWIFQQVHGVMLKSFFLFLTLFLRFLSPGIHPHDSVERVKCDYFFFFFCDKWQELKYRLNLSWTFQCWEAFRICDGLWSWNS